MCWFCEASFCRLNAMHLLKRQKRPEKMSGTEAPLIPLQ
jgi:hypothetical protein